MATVSQQNAAANDSVDVGQYQTQIVLMPNIVRTVSPKTMRNFRRIAIAQVVLGCLSILPAIGLAIHHGTMVDLMAWFSILASQDFNSAKLLLNIGPNATLAEINLLLNRSSSSGGGCRRDRDTRRRRQIFPLFDQHSHGVRHRIGGFDWDQFHLWSDRGCDLLHGFNEQSVGQPHNSDNIRVFCSSHRELLLCLLWDQQIRMLRWQLQPDLQQNKNAVVIDFACQIALTEVSPSLMSMRQKTL
ncbi:uncharacterized protein LOC143464746 isoform X3 [Clavelina lepadiformis]|uniref:uncharacterized protein LOC143464746 isoform X3 n=1 Tax=Clavelina lepadiformis TaxID=159417 RepID=UPI0040423D00